MDVEVENKFLKRRSQETKENFKEELNLSTKTTSTSLSTTSLAILEKGYLDVKVEKTTLKRESNENDRADKVVNLLKKKENLKKMIKLLKHSTSTLNPSTSTVLSNPGRNSMGVDGKEKSKKIPNTDLLVTSSTILSISALKRELNKLKEENKRLQKDRKRKTESSLENSSNTNKVKIVQYGSYELEEYQVAPMSGEEK